jgi:hypothetical protein
MVDEVVWGRAREVGEDGETNQDARLSMGREAGSARRSVGIGCSGALLEKASFGYVPILLWVT